MGENLKRDSRTVLVKKHGRAEAKEFNYLYGKQTGNVGYKQSFKNIFHKWTPEEEKKAFANKARMRALEDEFNRKDIEAKKKKMRRL